ncbi:hypothetical protein FRB90_005133 [Tulasnella sp. 427]|nr:hypothetical protein FRB90_005133 [Tulasnella sp. 427]
MPTPSKTHLPIKQFIADSNILDEDGAKDTDADVALLRLPAPGLRGTFAKAYALLARLVSQIGWDELLKTRSAVFVMEEEYRAQKAAASTQTPTKESHVIMKDGSVRDSGVALSNGKHRQSADDDASTKGIQSPRDGQASAAGSVGSVPGLNNTLRPTASTPIPVIKVSTESDREKEHEELRKHGVDLNGAETISEHPSAEGSDAGDEHVQEITIGSEAGRALEKPVAAAANEEPEDNGGRTSPRPGDNKLPSSDGFSFSNKRLCERWLDNLFMVLYEDLRIWTIFRAEVAHYKTQHVAYRKTGTEWEILGELGLRLHHKEEAKEAFLRSLEQKFSAKAWMKLLEMFAEENDLQRSLNAAIRLTAYQHRWYQESSYPTAIAHHLYKLGRIHGHAKISYTILSMGLPEGLLNMMQGYLNYGKMFKVEGYDY